jgi:hypothetical protein
MAVPPLPHLLFLLTMLGAPTSHPPRLLVSPPSVLARRLARAAPGF